ncbi:NDP-hexose 2,3-dehydratase family protein [Candidatus Kapabacteria bacterium]|nr:NDP-hexose 2,3-dehydratase family protein [Candidatus Kapabacteria bacterium]
MIISKPDLENFLDDTIQLSNFEIELATFEQQDEWQIKDDTISHKTGGFFHLIGLQLKDKQKLMLYQPQGAFNGLIFTVKKGQVFLLIQARIEPGNSGIGQFGPTIQSTPANYLRLHGGKQTPYLDYFMGLKPNSKLVFNSTQLDLGERYYQKTKILSYVFVEDELHLHQGMCWVSLNTIQECLFTDNFLNTDLKSMLGIFDWDSLLKPDTKTNDTHIELKIPYYKSDCNSKFIGLSELIDWDITNHGIEAQNPKEDISAKLFRVKTLTREKMEWYQPLITFSKKGRFILCYKIIENEYYFLLKYGSEFGIPGQFVFQPSFNFYAEDDDFLIDPSWNLIHNIIQSEEGGRFYKNENDYQIFEIINDLELKQDQSWFSTKQFKRILLTSNLCSIQLRCIASLVLPILNPSTFDSSN